ncbi:MAG: hypothetical protein ACYTEQ_15095 [Planctomycetota bacterium]|jgi:hypothetical protein
MTVESLVSGVARFFSWLHDDWEWVGWVLLTMALAAVVMGIGTLVRHLIRRGIMRAGANQAGEEKYWRTM